MLPMYLSKEIYYKELLHALMEAGKSSVGWQVKIQGNQQCRASQKTIGWRICFCPGRPLSCSICPSGDWMRLTHAMEGNMIYPKFIHLNVDVIQKHPPNGCIK